jgi:hypothetical protein
MKLSLPHQLFNACTVSAAFSPRARYRLGGELYERSSIDSSAGLRLRLNVESEGLKLDHDRPLVLSDGHVQGWSLANRSEELCPFP